MEKNKYYILVMLLGLIIIGGCGNTDNSAEIKQNLENCLSTKEVIEQEDKFIIKWNPKSTRDDGVIGDNKWVPLKKKPDGYLIKIWKGSDVPVNSRIWQEISSGKNENIIFWNNNKEKNDQWNIYKKCIIAYVEKEEIILRNYSNSDYYIKIADIMPVFTIRPKKIIKSNKNEEITIENNIIQDTETKELLSNIEKYYGKIIRVKGKAGYSKRTDQKLLIQEEGGGGMQIYSENYLIYLRQTVPGVVNPDEVYSIEEMNKERKYIKEFDNLKQSEAEISIIGIILPVSNKKIKFRGRIKPIFVNITESGK